MRITPRFLVHSLSWGWRSWWSVFARPAKPHRIGMAVEMWGEGNRHTEKDGGSGWHSRPATCDCWEACGSTMWQDYVETIHLPFEVPKREGIRF